MNLSHDCRQPVGRDLSMSERAAEVPEFRVFSVLGWSFAILFRNILPFGIIVLLFTAPAFIYYQYVADPLLY